MEMKGGSNLIIVCVFFCDSVCMYVWIDFSVNGTLFVWHSKNKSDKERALQTNIGKYIPPFGNYSRKNLK